MKPVPLNSAYVLTGRALSSVSPFSFLSLPAAALCVSTKKDCVSASSDKAQSGVNSVFM